MLKHMFPLKREITTAKSQSWYLYYLLVEQDICFTVLDCLRRDLGDILIIKLKPLL